MKTLSTSLILSMLALTACENGSLNRSLKPSMYEDTTTTQRNIVVEEEYFVETKSAADIDDAYLSSLVHDYNRNGTSPLYAVVAYNPDNRNARLSAQNTASLMKGQLSKMGVRTLSVKTMPVLDTKDQIVVGYDKIIARGPDNCGKMPGYEAPSGNPDAYGLGCTVKDMIAKQTAYPADLMGRDTMTAFDAGRAAAPVNRDVRSGEISEFPPSYILSEIGN